MRARVRVIERKKERENEREKEREKERMKERERKSKRDKRAWYRVSYEMSLNCQEKDYPTELYSVIERKRKGERKRKKERERGSHERLIRVWNKGTSHKITNLHDRLRNTVLVETSIENLPYTTYH